MSCGTDYGYRRHLRQLEPACEACKNAHRIANGNWRRANLERVNETRRRFRKWTDLGREIGTNRD